MSVRNILVLVSIPALLAACSTTQESPIYQQSTKYKVHSPHQSQGTATTQQATYQAPTYHQPATYTSGSAAPIYHHTASTTGQMVTTQVNHECLDKEGNRKLIGTTVGGAAGAFAGNKIGDTTGTIIGAVAGGALGYGVADVLTDCDPIEVASPVPAPVTYQSHSSTTPAQYHHTASNSTHSAPVVHDSAATERLWRYIWNTRIPRHDRQWRAGRNANGIYFRPGSSGHARAFYPAASAELSTILTADLSSNDCPCTCTKISGTTI